jgi:predicted HAD superfamily Cof-like phosphohydrolase
MQVTVDLEELMALRREQTRLAARVDELLEHNTRLVEERRAVDRKAMVRAFFVVAGQAIAERPRVPDDELLRFRLRLVVEEFFELLRACTCHLSCDMISEAELLVSDAIALFKSSSVNFPELVDATVDIDYVVEGLRIAFGVDSNAVWDEVHRANRNKCGGPRREDGKLMKPPGWKPPDIAGVLARMGAG